MTATGAWVQWGWFYSSAAARQAVADLQPGRVAYLRRGDGQVEVVLWVASP